MFDKYRVWAWTRRGSRAGSTDASLAPQKKHDHVLDGCCTDDLAEPTRVNGN